MRCMACIACTRRTISKVVPWNFNHANATIASMHSPPDSTDSERTRDDEAPSTTRTARLPHGQGIYLGMDNENWSFTGPERSVMVLGPSRSGKTSSLVIPNLLLAEGPVVSTSTKPEVMVATAAHRSSSGWAYLYDPSGEIECPNGVERIGWSPITTAGKWDTAVQTANAMVSATHPTMGSLLHGGANQHWAERASALLAPLLHAAAQENLPMKTVVRWIQRHDGTTPLEILGNSVGEENCRH